ncbi:MAG: hypothetical protein Q9166_002024 [cf. Caloplaca sp. 2 TL-2023]
MGASSKRKEVRRQKFATKNPEPIAEVSKEEKISSTSNASSPTDDHMSSHGVEGDQIEPAADDPQFVEPKSHRFVVFVATDASIQQHFASLKPTSIRHRCEKDSGKSRGFAFLEFDQYDRLKTCLKSFHESKFDDGISRARKLNVELTVGGGGKSKDRRIKLKEKNERLRQERERRALEEGKTKGNSVGAPKPVQKAVRDEGDHQDVHPSRRARVGGSR